jgi:PAS domain S-box-containing protein
MSDKRKPKISSSKTNTSENFTFKKVKKGKEKNKKADIAAMQSGLNRTLPDPSNKVKVAEMKLRARNEELQVDLRSVKKENCRYRSLFEFAPYGYIVTDGEGVIGEANLNATMLLNVSRKMLIGKPMPAFVAKEDFASFQERLLHLKKGERFPEWDIMLQPRRKSPRPVAVASAAVFVGEDLSPRIHWLLRDISETKRIQEELRRQTELFERLLACSAVGIAAFNTEFKCTLWNPTLERLSGLSKERTLGRNAFDLFPFLKEQGDDIFLLEMLAGKTGYSQSRRYCVRETGRDGFYDAEYSPLRNEAGAIVGGLVTVRDTTRKKEAEEALRQSEQKYRNLFENSTMGIFTVDLKGRYTSFNTAALRVLGYSLSEIIGDSYKKHIAPESAALVRKEYNRVFRTGRLLGSLQYDVITKSGERRTLESSVNLLFSKGEPAGFQASAIDITDRKRAEDTLRLTHLFLEVANKHSQMEPLLEDFVRIIREFFGCHAVGIRVLQADHGVAARTYRGFTRKFFESSCPLSTSDQWCLCRIAAEGSAEIFNLCDDLEARCPPSIDKAAFRPACREKGYKVVAAVPLRVEQRMVGFILLADRSRQTLREKNVKVLERAVSHIGPAIVRIQMNETVRRALELSRRKASEASALLDGSKAVLEHRDFERAAAAIVRSSREILGAAAGCITIRYPEGGYEEVNEYEEIVVLDSHASTDMKGLKFPVSGIPAAVYATAKSRCMNQCESTRKAGAIAEKMDAANILAAPMTLEGQVAGLLLLFNKPGGFCEDDASLAEAFAGQAAVALRNSKFLAALQRSEARYRWLSEGLEATVRKKVTELQQVKTLASIGQMVSVVAHEIRNPLQNIYMGVDALRREIEQDPAKREMLDEITYGVQMLNGIVRELLDYSKPVNLVYSSWSADEIITNSLSLLSKKLAPITVRKHLKNPEKKLLMDGEKISRVLVNLLNNAVEAMPNGGEVTIVSDFVNFEGNDCLRISVTDTGCGIDPETLLRIEEPFFTTKTQGTGLGISICRKIIQAHQGSLHFRSQKNEGTIAEMLLPAKGE